MRKFGDIPVLPGNVNLQVHKQTNKDSKKVGGPTLESGECANAGPAARA
jgi:hypothetical protein